MHFYSNKMTFASEMPRNLKRVTMCEGVGKSVWNYHYRIPSWYILMTQIAKSVWCVREWIKVQKEVYQNEDSAQPCPDGSNDISNSSNLKGWRDGQTNRHSSPFNIDKGMNDSLLIGCPDCFFLFFEAHAPILWRKCHYETRVLAMRGEDCEESSMIS